MEDSSFIPGASIRSAYRLQSPTTGNFCEQGWRVGVILPYLEQTIPNTAMENHIRI